MLCTRRWPCPREKEARVVLRLSIDAKGVVTDAVVTEPVGDGFDEAARDACLQFTFVPARVNDVPTASTILFAYIFERPPPKTGRVEGTSFNPGKESVPQRASW